MDTNSPRHNQTQGLPNSDNATSSMEPVNSTQSLMSVHSSNEFGNSCRICRWNQMGLEIKQCPCQCKGTVGYVHMECLQRWILHRGDNRCEVCGKKFDLIARKRSFKQMFRSFFQLKYLGAIIKNFVYLLTMLPISYIVFYQVLLIMDDLLMEEDNTVEILFLVPGLLLSSSIGFVFFHIFDFGLTRCLRIKNILRHWWLFGGEETDHGLAVDLSTQNL